MGNDTAVFDLGELEATRRSLEFDTPGSARASHARFNSRSPSNDIRIGPTATGLATSLSIFIPGTGQMLLGGVAEGLFILSSMVFLCTFGWAIVSTFDRLTATLKLFGAPPEAALWALPLLYILAATLHLSGVVRAHSLVSPWKSGRHPVLAGVASLLVPGWGQMLNGCYRRGTLFLGSLWAFGAGWILISEPARRMLSSVGLALPTSVTDSWSTPVLLTVPAVVWAIAVYDAFSFASVHRTT